MPDWIVHMAVAYSVCRILYYKYPVFNSANTVLAMLGAILPDVVKLDMINHLYSNYIFAFHTPFTSLILAGLISIFFKKKKLAFLFLSLGVISHFALDLLMIDVGAGIYLFFPNNWQIFHLDLISPDDYNITLIALLLAVSLYLLGILSQRRSNKKYIK